MAIPGMGAPGAGAPGPMMPKNPAGGPPGPGAPLPTTPGLGAGNAAAAQAMVTTVLDTLERALMAFPGGSKEYMAVLNAIRSLSSTFNKPQQKSMVPASILQMQKNAANNSPMAAGPAPPLAPVAPPGMPPAIEGPPGGAPPGGGGMPGA